MFRVIQKGHYLTCHSLPRQKQLTCLKSKQRSKEIKANCHEVVLKHPDTKYTQQKACCNTKQGNSTICVHCEHYSKLTFLFLKCEYPLCYTY